MTLNKTLIYILQIRKSRQCLTLLLPYTVVDNPVLWKTQSSKIFCPTMSRRDLGLKVNGVVYPVGQKAILDCISDKTELVTKPFNWSYAQTLLTTNLMK